MTDGEDGPPPAWDSMSQTLFTWKRGDNAEGKRKSSREENQGGLRKFICFIASPPSETLCAPARLHSDKTQTNTIDDRMLIAG